MPCYCKDDIRFVSMHRMNNCTRALNEVLLAFLSVTHRQTNKYTLAEIRLPFTMISCLASCSAIICIPDSLLPISR